MNKTSPTSFSILRNHIEAFSKITEDDWNLFQPHLIIQTIRKNELLIAEGKRALNVGFVLEGMFRRYYTNNGEEKTTYFFFENHFISSYISCINTATIYPLFTKVIGC